MDQGKPLLSGGKKFSKLLLHTLHGIIKDIKEMRREKHGDPSTRFGHEEIPSSSYYEYDHSAIPSNLKCSTSHMFMTKKMERGDVLKKETLGDFLQEYESQTKRFKDHINFQEFLNIKEERRTKGNHHGVGRFFLSTFDGSPKCLVRVWVEELNTYVQQHQVPENEAIKVAVLHL